jgi:predicted ribosomally synthesized peptide with SipW-like signal peptide
MEEWKAGLRISQSSNLPIFQSSDWHIAGYVLTTAASLYTHYFTIFLLIFQNLAWLLGTLSPHAAGGVRRRRLEVWLGTQLAILALFLPQLPLALRQTTAYANPNLNPPGVGEFVTRAWLAFTVGTAVDPEVRAWLAGGLAVILGLAVVFQAVKGGRGLDQPMGTAGFLVAWFLVPLAVYFLVLQRRPSFEPRYMMLVTPALLLLVGWWLGARGEGLQRGWARPGLLAALAVFGAGTWAYFTNVASYKDDSAGVANWLAAETTSNDVVYVDVPHPFHYYAERIPAPMRYLFVDVHTAADVLNAEAAGRDRFFWVTWRGSDTDPRGVIPFLLDKAGRREGERDWRGYHVAWWALPGDARFSLPDELSPGDVTFGDVIRLDGRAFSPEAQAGEAAWATLRFTLLRDADADYRVSLRLRDAAGNMLPPADKDLLNDRHMRTSAWPLGDARLNQAINVYTLPVPPEAEPGEYCLEVVVYAATTLDALPASGALLSGPGCASAPGDGISARLGRIAIASPLQGKR